MALALLVLGTASLIAGDTRIPVSSGWSVLPLWFLVPGVVWLVSIPTVAAWWAVALPRALRMARPRSADLVVSALLAVLVALLMTAPVLLVAAVGYRSVRLWGFGGEAVVVGVCVAGLVTGWLVSVVSALRGLPAIWARDRRAPT